MINMYKIMYNRQFVDAVNSKFIRKELAWKY